MSVASRGGNAVSALLRNSSRICSQCSRSRPQRAIIASFPAARRHFAEAAAPSSSSPSEVPPSDDTSAPPSAPTSVFPYTAPSHFRLKAGLILSRAPLLTRMPTPFESAFYLYQKRLDERLAVPFQKSFYFRKDTASDLDWRIKIRERHGVAAKDIGRYNPRGRVAWNDEVLVGSRTSEPEHMVEKLLEDAEMRVSDDGEAIAEEERVKVERPMPRRTEADEKNDVKRLDRALDKTLYFVVKRENGEWGFPMGTMSTDEALHETAKRVLEESAGVNMNTWIVGRVPVAHYIKKPLLAEGEDPKAAPEKKGEKVFFLKGRIMAGQADLTGNRHGLTDFKWVTKEELAQTLPHEAWRAVKNMVDLR